VHSVERQAVEAAAGADGSQSSSTEPVTVVLAYGDEEVRIAIRRALERHGVSVLAETHDAKLAILRAEQHRPVVCLLDASITSSGVAVEEIREALPSVRIAVLGNSLGTREVMAAIQAGADGYLLRSTAPDRVSAAVIALAHGESVLPRAFTSHLVAETRRSPSPSPVRRIGTGLHYPFRLLRHYRRRRRAQLSVGDSWASARQRMRRYR
jgi:DNA-binding NarL/FixJ family response regulator